MIIALPTSKYFVLSQFVPCVFTVYLLASLLTCFADRFGCCCNRGTTNLTACSHRCRLNVMASIIRKIYLLHSKMASLFLLVLIGACRTIHSRCPVECCHPHRQDSSLLEYRRCEAHTAFPCRCHGEDGTLPLDDLAINSVRC